MLSLCVPIIYEIFYLLQVPAYAPVLRNRKPPGRSPVQSFAVSPAVYALSRNMVERAPESALAGFDRVYQFELTRRRVPRICERFFLPPESFLIEPVE